jgi:hypothetical protein
VLARDVTQHRVAVNYDADGIAFVEIFCKFGKLCASEIERNGENHSPWKLQF